MNMWDPLGYPLMENMLTTKTVRAIRHLGIDILPEIPSFNFWRPRDAGFGHLKFLLKFEGLKMLPVHVIKAADVLTSEHATESSELIGVLSGGYASYKSKQLEFCVPEILECSHEFA